MEFGISIDTTSCCALGVIEGEYHSKDCSVDFAVKEVRRRLYRQLPSGDFNLRVTTLVATTSTEDKERFKFLNSVYKAAGFKSMGRALYNPNSQNHCKKWYINLPLDFQP